MTNGINFGMDGPQVTGWWVNPKTGDKFNAIDTFFEDNNLLIKTADGRLLNYNQIQNYIQTDNPDSFNKPQSKSSSTNDDIPASILAELADPSSTGASIEDILIPDDDIYGTPKSTKNQMFEDVAQTAQSNTIKDFDIINRALNNKTYPDIYGDIEWKNFPKREIEMLVDVMQISEESIVAYYINSISIEEIQKQITKCVEDYVKQQLHLTKENIENKTKSPTSVKPTTKKKNK